MSGILAAVSRCSLLAKSSVLRWFGLTIHACTIAIGRLRNTATLQSHLVRRTVQLAVAEILAEQE